MCNRSASRTARADGSARGIAPSSRPAPTGGLGRGRKRGTSTTRRGGEHMKAKLFEVRDDAPSHQRIREGGIDDDRKRTAGTNL